MRRLALAALVLLTLAVLAPAASAGLGMPEALTPRGKIVEGLYTMIAVLGIGMFLLVFGWLVVVIWRFREGSGHGKATHEKERHSLKAELAWTLVPLALVLYIGYAAYGGLVQLDHGIPLDQVQMEVRVTGSQWNWNFDYGQGVSLFSNPDPTTGNVSAGNTFFLPQDTNILFNITSADVIHAFQVMDAHRAFVIFLDANPLGANKYNLQTANLPGGDYFVQCNKMCLNPGHAYMHAAIKAVPRATFDHWLAQKVAAGGNPLLTQISATVSNGLLFGADGNPVPAQTLAASGRLVLDVEGPHGDLSLTVGDQHATIPAGETVKTFAGFDFPQPGNYTVQVADTEGAKTTLSTIAVHAVQAVVKTVDLGAYRLLPDHLDLKAGTTYLIQLPNVHTTGHDLQIGHWDAKSPTILAGTAAISPGATGALLWTPGAPGQYDMWCNQGGPTGHHSLGMFGTVTVT